MIIVNRVTVPGPRQVLLHVKIAEINRSATRAIGVSWLYSRGKSIIGSAVGNNATFSDDRRQRVSARPSAREDSPGPSRGASSGTCYGHARRQLRRSSACSTRGISRCSSTPCASNSLAKILAEPNLMALDGQPARFLVGGLFPYPVPQSSLDPRRHGRGHRPVPAASARS